MQAQRIVTRLNTTAEDQSLEALLRRVARFQKAQAIRRVKAESRSTASQASTSELKTDHAPAASGNVQPKLKYAWQQAVLNALMESRPAYLPGRLNAAQRAISARLCDKTTATLDEQIAIREALNFLRTLFPDRTEREEECDNKAQTA